MRSSPRPGACKVRWPAGCTSTAHGRGRWRWLYWWPAGSAAPGTDGRDAELILAPPRTIMTLVMASEWCHSDIMKLQPYVDAVRHELSVAAGAGGDAAQELADRLSAPLES